MCLWLLVTVCLFSELSRTFGYLYPYETESREIRSLDGLWDFKICPEDKVDLGFTDSWYSKNFEEVISIYHLSNLNFSHSQLAACLLVGSLL